MKFNGTSWQYVGASTGLTGSWIYSFDMAVLGGIIYLAKHGSQPADYRVFHGEPSELRGVRSIVRYALDLHGRGIIQLGLLMLIATPVARVAFSIFGFAAEKDRLYMSFTALVLAILLYSLLGTA